MNRLEESIARIREFSRSIDKSEFCIFTFEDKEAAASAEKVLKDKEFVFTLTAKPEAVMQFTGSHIALACMTSDRQKIGGILGENGIDVAGTHTIRPQCRTTTKKEQAF